MIDARVVKMGVFGLGLGLALSFIGFADWGEVHKMFTLASPRLFLAFGGGVALTAIGFALFGGRGLARSRPIHRGTVIGAVLFGVGWAIAGACPGACLAMIGEGRLPALVALAGIVAGVAIHAALRPRLGVEQTSCES
jgi:hypothetical protein